MEYFDSPEDIPEDIRESIVQNTNKKHNDVLKAIVYKAGMCGGTYVTFGKVDFKGTACNFTVTATVYPEDEFKSEVGNE